VSGIVGDHRGSEQSWFFEFSSQCEHLPQLARLQRSTVLKIPSVGVKSAANIASWQKRAHFSPEVEWVGEMIQEDAKRCLELHEKIHRLAVKIAEVGTGSKIAKILRSILGFGEGVYFRIGRRDRHRRAVS
jgi:hypothetical protein